MLGSSAGRFLPRAQDVKGWGEDEVITLLQKNDLSDCAEAFRKHQINGYSFLELTEDKLLRWTRELKIKNIRKITKLVTDINQNLGKSMNGTTYPSSDDEESGWSSSEFDEELGSETQSATTMTTVASLRDKFNQQPPKPSIPTKPRILIGQRPQGARMNPRIPKSPGLQGTLANNHQAPTLPKPPKDFPGSPSFRQKPWESDDSDGTYEIPNPPTTPRPPPTTLLPPKPFKNPVEDDPDNNEYETIQDHEERPPIPTPTEPYEIPDSHVTNEDDHGSGSSISSSTSSLSSQVERQVPQKPALPLPTRQDKSQVVSELKQSQFFYKLKETVAISPPSQLSTLTSGRQAGSPSRGHERPLPPTPGPTTSPAPVPVQLPAPPSSAPPSSVPPSSAPFQSSAPTPPAISKLSRPSLDHPVLNRRPLPPPPPFTPPNSIGNSKRNSTHNSAPTTPDSTPSIPFGDAGQGPWTMPHRPNNSGSGSVSPASGSTPRDLRSFSWFHAVERGQAEALLHGKPDGTYLVRDSRHGGTNNPLTLSLWYGGRMYHVNIRQRVDGKYALGKEKANELSFVSVEELVTTHQREQLKLHSGGQVTGVTCLVATVSAQGTSP